MKKIALLFILLYSFALCAINKPVFYFFYSKRCPHCHEAQPFIDFLSEQFKDIDFKQLEVSSNDVNKEIFKKKLTELSISKPGVPLFVFGKDYIIGFRKGIFEKKILEMIRQNLKKLKKKSSKNYSIYEPVRKRSSL